MNNMTTMPEEINGGNPLEDIKREILSIVGDEASDDMITQFAFYVEGRERMVLEGARDVADSLRKDEEMGEFEGVPLLHSHNHEYNLALTDLLSSLQDKITKR